MAESPVNSGFLGKFTTKKNREFFERIRELAVVIRELPHPERGVFLARRETALLRKSLPPRVTGLTLTPTDIRHNEAAIINGSTKSRN